MVDIRDVAAKLGLVENDLFMYGNTIAKVTKEVESFNDDSNFILITAVNPTSHGEGKTTVSIGLSDAFCKLGYKSIAALREPSLGPVFGLKGGACGGGCANLIEEEQINLHFTGDFHAITSANNLMCAAVDYHIFQGNELKINKDRICIKRCIDMNDRSLRDKFNITAASEVMAIFCLATDRVDLRNRLANILVAYDLSDNPVYARDLKVDGAMYKLLEHAFYPNLVQSLEGNPVLIHGGPFANIAHGCSSIVADKLALNISEYVVGEAGFGSDLGAEKFLNIKSRLTKVKPKMVVLVTTVRALECNGLDNLGAHIDHLKSYNIKLCVTINHFFDDKKEDIEKIIDYCKSQNVDCIICDPFNKGSDGCLELANYIVKNKDTSSQLLTNLYPLNMSIVDKMQILATKVYHASNVAYSDGALEKLDEIERLGISHYPICVSKTPFSISDDKEKKGYPKNYVMNVDDIIIQTGSRMIILLLNKVLTMPGLPKKPRYENFE